MHPLRRFFLLLLLVALPGVACAAGDPAIFGAGGRGVGEGSTTTLAPSPTTTTTTTLPPPTAGVATTPAGGVQLFAGPGSDATVRLHENIELGFSERQGEWLLVTTPCNTEAWLREGDVAVTRAARQTWQEATMEQLVIVLDPGHGGRDWGAVGGGGLSEKDVNIDIASRARDLLSSTHSVDWVTGEIGSGSTYPAVELVVLTRRPDGPDEGDFEAGLAYRAELANRVGAHAFISIHNNSVPIRDTPIPGSEVYYAVSVPGSDRLAGLLYEELLRSFESFDAQWQGGSILGARARIDRDTGTDYYGILRRAEMPAVIAEGLYITNPDEESLLRTPELRQAYADAIYRAVVRFFTTTEPGASINDPEIFGDDSGTASTSSCVLPEQP